jgi:uncharacterized protein YkwD
VSLIARRTFLLSLPVAGLTTLAALANPRQSSAIVTGQAMVLINRYRGGNNREPLVIDPRAESAALQHAEEMARLGALTHANFDQRLEDAGIVSPSAENVALGHDTVAQVIRAWQKSSQHRRNLLGSYNRFGMAVARNANSGNRPYWAMILSE